MRRERPLEPEMYDLSEFALLSGKNPPRWVGAFRFLITLWVSPVFQRGYARRKLRGVPPPLWSFLLPLVALLTLDSVGLFGMDVQTAQIYFLIVNGSALVVTYLRCVIPVFFGCLISSAIEIRRDIGEANLNPMLSTPLTDRDIYLGVSLPGVARSFELIWSFLLSVAGIYISALIAFCVAVGMGFVPGEILNLIVEYGVYVALGMVLVPIEAALVMAVMALLLSLAAGIYAVRFGIAGSIVVTWLHYVGAGWVAGILSAFVRIPFAVLGMFGVPGYWLGPFAPGLVMIYGSYVVSEIARLGVLVVACLITARIGGNMMAQVRREGHYWPYYTTPSTFQ